MSMRLINNIKRFELKLKLKTELQLAFINKSLRNLKFVIFKILVNN